MATATATEGSLAQSPDEHAASGARLQLGELLTAEHHSRDFTATRGEYIAARLAVVQLLFAVGFLAWSPIDYILLAAESEATALLGARIALAVVLAALFIGTRKVGTYRASMVLLAATIIAVGAFYVASMAILQERVGSDLIGGYSALPFVLIVLTALFPVTVAFGAGLVVTILALNVGVEAYLGQLASVSSINTLWMLVLVGAVVVWVQAGQLALQLRLYRESARDPVTGLVTRQVFRRVVDRELQHAREQEQPVALVSLSLAGIDRIRDEYGQFAADRALAQAARALQRLPGNEELQARYEGDMLVAALMDYDAVAATVEAEQLRARIERARIEAPDGSRLPLEPSVAVGQFGAGEALDAVMDRIGQARVNARGTQRRQVLRA